MAAAQKHVAALAQDPLFQKVDLIVYQKDGKRINVSATRKSFEAYRHRSASRWVAKHGNIVVGPDGSKVDNPAARPTEQPVNRQQRRAQERAAQKAAAYVSIP